MSSIIQNRLATYKINTQEQEENALKEIAQEILLYGLSLSGFFEDAMFQGGTSLRILYQLPRFSEDMDFILNKPNKDFKWSTYKEAISEVCEEYGIEPLIQDKSKTNTSIQRLFIKDDSLGKILKLNFKNLENRKILIKLEVDINPPEGSHKAIKYLDFPLDYAIVAQDLASSFASKSHALLCRTYTKGRDWYDFLWYISQRTPLNFDLLSNAINQTGPWKSKGIIIDVDWYIHELESKIQSIDWEQTKADVVRFLNERERHQLNLWCKDFFMNKLDILKKYLNPQGPKN